MSLFGNAHRQGLSQTTDRQEQPSSSRGPSPAPQFANRGNEGGQLERSRKLNSEGLEVTHCLRALTYAIQQLYVPSTCLIMRMLAGSYTSSLTACTTWRFLFPCLPPSSLFHLLGLFCYILCKSFLINSASFSLHVCSTICIPDGIDCMFVHMSEWSRCIHLQVKKWLVAVCRCMAKILYMGVTILDQRRPLTWIPLIC